MGHTPLGFFSLAMSDVCQEPTRQQPSARATVTAVAQATGSDMGRCWKRDAEIEMIECQDGGFLSHRGNPQSVIIHF